MYDERIYFDLVSGEIFCVRFYIDYTFKYFNIPERFNGTHIPTILSQYDDFEDFLDKNHCVVVGHV
jgi:hypothetical protein